MLLVQFVIIVQYNDSLNEQGKQSKQKKHKRWCVFWLFAAGAMAAVSGRQEAHWSHDFAKANQR